ncbi:MAG: hypothetical protein HJJLKODD_01128 [Phycisphaerae bacterium]|nr:hypothetical protein [Phycisphaerae bacterium]
MITTRANIEELTTLPGELQELTTRVVRQTRLWRRERRDVQAELESHFREGLIELQQDGLTLEQCIKVLKEQFGDEVVLAKLIRRGKKRGRPMIYKVFVYTMAVTFGGAGSLGGLVWWRAQGEPNPTVDYVARLNEPILAIPEEQRAWPLLREAILQVEPMPKVLQELSALPAPDDQEWSMAESWVAQNKEALDLVRQAVQRPRYGYLYDWQSSLEYRIEDARRRGDETDRQELEFQLAELKTERNELRPLISLVLPSLRSYRDIARMYILDSRRCADHENWSQAWQELESSCHLGGLLLQGKTLIEQLVGAAILNLTLSEMVQLQQAHDAEFTDEAWLQIHNTKLWISAIQIETVIDFEQMTFEDVVQFVFTDDGQDNGHLLPKQYDEMVNAFSQTAPDGSGDSGWSHEAKLATMAAMHADRKSTLATYYQLWSEIARYRELPLYDAQRAEADRVLDQFKNDPEKQIRFAMVCNLMPSLGRADQLLRELEMNLAAMNTIIALQEFRRQAGAYPVMLSELLPDYLDALPEDVYSGQPLKYEMTEAGDFKLYSVWRNLQDDSGSSVKMNEPDSPNDPEDWVYWPVHD